jgi:hypothetical protein
MVMTTPKAILASCVTVLFGIALAQTATDEPTKSVRISGRLVFPDGSPASFGIRMARIDPDGFKDEDTTTVGRDGRFMFMAVLGYRYRISLAAGGMKTPPRTADITTSKDVDIGDMVFEYCPAVTTSIPKPPTVSELVGDLRPEQIVIEPQQPVNPYRPVADLPPANYKPNNALELPPCWSGPSLEKRQEWESFPMISFDRYMTVESFVGGKVKVIRVVGYDPKLTPSQIRQEVRKVWLAVFWFGASSIMWSEGNRWNIQALVEYEDGKRSSILMDGWVHVQVEDREGKYWFIRLSPAVQ